MLPFAPHFLARRKLALLLALAASVLSSGCGAGRAAKNHTTGAPMTSTPTGSVAYPTEPYPKTRRDDVRESVHGVEILDSYRWLEDGKAEEVKAWASAEDHFTRARLSSEPERAVFEKRLSELMYFDAVSAPLVRKKRSFWRRRHADREKDIVYWREGDAGEPKVLLDPNSWSTDGSLSLGGIYPSPDGRYLAYNQKPNNADEAALHVIEVASGRVLDDRLPGTKYGYASWTPDSKGFYYVRVPELGGEVTVQNRPGLAALYHHTLGTDPTKDPLIREPTHDPETFLSGGVSEDGHFLIVTISHGWNSNDVYFRDLRKKDGSFHTLVSGIDAQFDVEVFADRFYVLTNHEAARGRVLRVDPAHVELAAWQEVVPEDAEASLQQLHVVGGKLLLLYLRRATSEIELHDLDGRLAHKLALPGHGSITQVQGLSADDAFYFGYTSFVEPSLVFRASAASGAVTEWSRVSLPFDPASIAVEQVVYPSRDGTSVSMFLLRRKDLIGKHKLPTILYGYGGFRINLTPEFAATRIPWLEHGGVYAIANLRGGAEYGEAWHRAGMQANKQNVFDDFIWAAKWLIAHEVTEPSKLAISGGSNGGLLVGAAMTQAPELFRAVVCSVPLLDMVRYHLYGSGRTWIPEYGSAEDEAEFRTLFAYSPYHHLRPGVRYPALLMLTSADDDRVDPMHARKFTALAQSLFPGDRVALLRVEEQSGHGGADLVKKRIATSADTFAFLVSQLH
jgi:prolyl oligopeptidase